MREPALNCLQADEPEVTDPSTSDRQADEAKSLANERSRAQVEGLVQDRDQRKAYGRHLSGLVAVRLATIGVIVVLHGCTWVPFKLPAAALTTLIGSTTISVLGLFAIVAN